MGGGIPPGADLARLDPGLRTHLVYGNLGWGSPGPPPIGAAGLVRFGSDLTRKWQFAGGRGPMDDLEAINVAGETAWASYSVDFPVVEVTGGEVRSWSTSSSDFVSTLVVSGERVALVVEGLERLVVGQLVDGRHEVEREYRLAVPDGAQVFGRGSDLHVVAGREWYRLEVPGFG